MEIHIDKNTQHLQEFDITIPCWNSERTLVACLRGLQKSDIPIRKIYVIDQCSTDGTIEIAKSFGTEIVSHSGNYTDAILLCAKSATTEYYMSIESDVIVTPNFFTKLSAYYRENFITKGIVKNYLPERYEKIALAEMNYYTRIGRLAGFALFIAHRQTFLDVFQKVIAPYNSIDAGSDTLMHIYCKANGISCYQDTSVISIHLVMSLQKMWRSQIWYGASVKHIPRILEYPIIKIPPRILSNLIEYKDIHLLFHNIVSTACWLWGWFTG